VQPPSHKADSGNEAVEHEEQQPNGELFAPLKGDNPDPSAWTLVAHNKKVVKGWASLSRNTPENVMNAYDWLRKDAMMWKPGRCYPLRGEKYSGCWAYEIGAGDRLYYKPDESTKIAKIYYAGVHPRDVPVPPTNL